MIAVDREQFLRDGYLIIRGLIPPEQLEARRATFERLVDKQRAIWAAKRKPDDPPGGVWEKSAQPRVQFDEVVDRETAAAVEFCLSDRVLGVARQLIRTPEVAINYMAIMCSPVRDHGAQDHRGWHRDIRPIDQAPLQGLIDDLVEYGPAYVQWNIPLYDDKVLWAVPGAHRRLYTAEEDRSLRADPRVPVPGGIPVELKAGDGVVYVNTILHWGSAYDAKLRRTVHLGFRGFGGPIYPYVQHLYWAPGVAERLPEEQAAPMRHYVELFAREIDTIEALYRAMIARDAAAFRTHLAALHPGERHRMTAVVLLSKVALQLRAIKLGDLPDIPGMKMILEGFDATTDRQMAYALLARRFTPDEVRTLWERVAPLDRRLQADTVQFVPAFQSVEMQYEFERMPAGFGVEEFIESWAPAPAGSRGGRA